MNLIALPAFTDNYIWMLHDGRQAAVVDPGDATPVLAALDREGLALAAILVTHHHPDHVAGIGALQSRLGGPVYGPAREDIPYRSEALQEGAQIEVLGLRFQVLEVPGHTTGHIAYLQRDVEHDALLFCGDTLFSAGCGRLFEGTAAQMQASLARLAALRGDTRVACTHEYTISNLRFASAVEPGNAAIAQHRAHCDALRAADRPTLPSRIDLEREINPFLRWDAHEVKAAAAARGAQGDPVSVFAALREWKNIFR